MTLRDLAIVYVLAGVACAVLVYRRGGGAPFARVASALAAVPLWPLWAPFALSAREAAPRRVSADCEPAVRRIDRALQDAVAAAAGTPHAAALTPEARERIAAEVGRIARRIVEIDEVAAAGGLDAEAAARKLASLAEGATGERALGAARLHLAACERAAALRQRHAEALGELADLLEALSAQLTLARLGDAGDVDPTGTLAEVWARLEVVGAGKP